MIPFGRFVLSALSGRYCRSVLWDAWIKWVVCRALPRPRLSSNLLHPGAHTKQFKFTSGLLSISVTSLCISNCRRWNSGPCMIAYWSRSICSTVALSSALFFQQTERTLPCGEIPRQVKSLWRLIGGGVWHQLQRRHKRGRIRRALWTGVPLPNHWPVPRQPKERDMGGIHAVPLVVTIPIYIPSAVAIDADLEATITVPVTHDRQVTRQAKIDNVRGVLSVPLIITIPINNQAPFR